MRPVGNRGGPTAGIAGAGVVAAGIAGIVGAFVAAAAMTAAALGGAALIDFPMPSYLPNQAMSTLVVVVAALALWTAASRRLPEYARTIAGLLAPAAASAIHQSFLLFGTSHYLNGIGGDQLNRVTYLGRFASSPALADAFYSDAAPFYPAGWFWLGGRIADLVGVPAWEFYKPFAIFTMALAGSLAFLAWRALAGSRVAIPLALATVAVGLALAAYEPYSWLFIAVLPAVAVWAQRIGSARYAAYIGVFLGLAAVTYTLIAAVGVVVVTAGAAFSFARTPRDGRGTRLRIARNWVAAGIVSALIALLFWTPYLLAVLRGDGHERSVATDFAPEDAAHWPAPMLEFTGLGVLCFAGLVWLAWTVAGIRRERSAGEAGEAGDPGKTGEAGSEAGLAEASTAPIAQIALGLTILVVSGYAWFALSGLRAMGATTLLPFRMTPVITLALACAGVFALREVWNQLRARAREFDASGEPRGTRERQFAALACVVVAMITVHSAQAVSDEDAEFTANARSAPGEPTAVVEAISDVTGGAEPQDLVVLSDDTSLYMFQPYWAFQAPAAAYAAPTGEYEKRNELIASWATARDGAELADTLRSGEFRAPDVLVLTPTKGADGEKWEFMEVVNTMPLEGNILRVPLEFDPELFADPAMFHVEHAGGRVVIGVR